MVHITPSYSKLLLRPNTLIVRWLSRTSACMYPRKERKLEDIKVTNDSTPKFSKSQKKEMADEKKAAIRCFRKKKSREKKYDPNDWRSIAYKLRTKDGNFVDWKLLKVKGKDVTLQLSYEGGDGGSGCGSLVRKSDKTAILDGGDGGHGGNVYFISDEKVSSLKNVDTLILGHNGTRGRGKNLTGEAGEDLIIPIPVGTCLEEVPLKENIDNSRYLYRPLKKFIDFDKPGMKELVARGGRRGRGNLSLKDYERNFEDGRAGEVRRLSLELKTLADIGLLGLPNAGKSSLLRQISNSKPKVAPYPFTTLNPYIGSINFQDKYRFTVADIPGVIMGAHLNYGLGFSFLRHIERSKVIIYVLDLSTPEPWNDYQILHTELKKYKKELLEKPSMILANKLDRIKDSELQAKVDLLKSHCPQIDHVIPISAKYRVNISNALEAMSDILNSINETANNSLQIDQIQENK